MLRNIAERRRRDGVQLTLGNGGGLSRNGIVRFHHSFGARLASGGIRHGGGAGLRSLRSKSLLELASRESSNIDACLG